MALYRIRSQGSAAINMCTVASGRADAYWEFGIHAWDVAAGDLIVREAGGVVLSTDCTIVCSVAFQRVILSRQNASVARSSIRMNGQQYY